MKLTSNALGMLIAKYRSVYKNCFLKGVAALVAASFICCVAPAAATNYTVGGSEYDYDNLEKLWQANITFNPGDTITMYAGDNSLTNALSFGGKDVTIDFQGMDIVIEPSVADKYFLNLSGGTVTFANASQAIVSGFKRSSSSTNVHGGAVYLNNSSTLNAEDATFESNSVAGYASDSYGGAVYLNNSSTLNANGATFESNSAAGYDSTSSQGYAGRGGAVSLGGSGSSTLNAEYATFVANSATGYAGYGGAVHLSSDGSIINANGATFTSNSASGAGSSGAYFSHGYGGAIYLLSDSTLNVEGAIFESNFASASGAAFAYSHGGAIYAWNGEINAAGATFTSNYVSSYGSSIDDGSGRGRGVASGGAVELIAGTLNAKGAIFTSNFASGYMDSGGLLGVGQGGAAYVSYSTVDAEGATFTSNTAYGDTDGLGGAIYLYNGSTLNAKNASFLNNIASHYGGAIYAFTSIYSGASVNTINLGADDGKVSTFSGNMANGQASSIYFDGEYDATNVLTVDGAGTLDMLDPMTSSSDNYNIKITKNGTGTWKLGGNNEFNASGTDGTTFAVNAGTLELYQDASITINQGSFTVGDNATLSLFVGTNPAVVAENVSFDSGSSLNVGGYSGSKEGDTVTLIQAANAIASMTNHYTIGGNTGVDYLSALVRLSDDSTAVLADVGLTWYNNSQDLADQYDKAHGTFTIDGADNSFTLGTDLEDRSGTFTTNNWDGKSLTKAGDGTLILTGNNTYTGDTIIEAGTLTIEDVNSLSSTSHIENNSVLNLFASSTASSTYNINSYSGSGVVGIKASLTAQDQWSDLLNFSSTPESVNVHFYFADGSSTDYLSDDGLQFAHLSTADGTDSTFALNGFSSLAGASELGITTSDYQDYYLTATFNPSLGKVYPEASAAQLSQASWMHNRELFKVTEQASRQADKHITGIAVGFNRNDYRQETGSHADIDGNSLAMAVAFKANDETTWGIFGQNFDGSYKTSHNASLASGLYTVHSNGDLDTHEVGLFAEYRPIREAESSYYYQAFISAGRSTNKFSANNASTTISGISTFKSGRNLFAASVGGGYVVNTASDETTDYYSHLIYTRLSGDSVTDSIGQNIKLQSSESVRLLSGVKFNFNQDKNVQSYFGVALDYEFSGKVDAYVNGNKANSASIKGLTGILELGLTAKQSDALTIDLGLHGYMGKKEGLGGMVTVSTRF